MSRFKLYADDDDRMIGIIPLLLDGEPMELKLLSIPPFSFNTLSETGQTVIFEKVDKHHILAVVSDDLVKYSINKGAVSYFLGGPKIIDGNEWPYWAMLNVIEHCIYTFLEINNALEMEDGQVTGFKRDVKQGRLEDDG